MSLWESKTGDAGTPVTSVDGVKPGADGNVTTGAVKSVAGVPGTNPTAAQIAANLDPELQNRNFVKS